MTHLVLLLCCFVGSVCAFFSDLVKFENVTAHAGDTVNLTCSVPSNESVSRIEVSQGSCPGDGIPTLAVATSNNGTHITTGGHNYSLTLEWLDATNTSVSLVMPNVTLQQQGYYTCNVTLKNCSVALGVQCNDSAEEGDANRTLTNRMYLTISPPTTVAPTTVSQTTSTSHRPSRRRPVTKRPTHKPVTPGPFPVDPWRPRPTWVYWAMLLITCAVVAPVLLVIIISCIGWLAGWGRRRKGWIPV